MRGAEAQAQRPTPSLRPVRRSRPKRRGAGGGGRLARAKQQRGWLQGVHVQGSRYVAYVARAGKKVYLGMFATTEEAALAVARFDAHRRACRHACRRACRRACRCACRRPARHAAAATAAARQASPEGQLQEPQRRRTRIHLCSLGPARGRPERGSLLGVGATGSQAWSGTSMRMTRWPSTTMTATRRSECCAARPPPEGQGSPPSPLASTLGAAADCAAAAGRVAAEGVKPELHVGWRGLHVGSGG